MGHASLAVKAAFLVAFAFPLLADEISGRTRPTQCPTTTSQYATSTVCSLLRQCQKNTTSSPKGCYSECERVRTCVVGMTNATLTSCRPCQGKGKCKAVVKELCPRQKGKKARKPQRGKNQNGTCYQDCMNSTGEMSWNETAKQSDDTLRKSSECNSARSLRPSRQRILRLRADRRKRRTCTQMCRMFKGNFQSSLEKQARRQARREVGKILVGASNMVRSARKQRMREGRQNRGRRKCRQEYRERVRQLILDAIGAIELEGNTPAMIYSSEFAVSVACPNRSQDTVVLHAFQRVTGNSSIELTLDSHPTAANTSKAHLLFQLPIENTGAHHSQYGQVNGTDGCSSRVVEFIVYDTSELFQYDPENATQDEVITVASPVVSAKFQNATSHKFQERKAKIHFLFEKEDGKTPLCAFWAEESSTWKTDGCRRTEPTDGRFNIACECDHLTNFAVILVPGASSNQLRKILVIISRVGGSLSILCLFLTALNILLIKKLRQNVFQRILLLLSLSMILLFVMLLSTAEATANKTACRVFSVITHHSLLTVFALVVVACVHLHIKIVNVFNRDRVALASYFLPIVGPTLIVAITAGATQMNAYGSANGCVLNHKSVAFYTSLVAPMCLMVLVNGCIYVAVMRIVLKKGHHRRSKGKERSVMRQRLSMLSTTVSLAAIMGLTWVAGVLLLIYKWPVTEVLFVVQNALQGVFIFVFYVLKSSEVRGVWHGRYTTKRNRSTSLGLTKNTSECRTKSFDVQHSCSTVKLVRVEAIQPDSASQSVGDLSCSNSVDEVQT